MRAVHTQMLLRSIERLPAADRDAVRALAGRATLAEVDAVLPVAWHPMALHMRLSDAARDVVGPERNVALWSDTMAASFERPLLKGFVQMSTSLFGLTPPSLLRQGDRIYGQLTRDLGALRFDADASGSSGEVTLRGFPADRFRFVCYVEGLQGCIAACFPLAGGRGEVAVADQDEGRGDVRYRLRWMTTLPPSSRPRRG
jgi:hypothetical protein